MNACAATTVCDTWAERESFGPQRMLRGVGLSPARKRILHFSSYFSTRAFCSETCPFHRDKREKNGDFRLHFHSLIFGIYRALIYGCRSISAE